MPPKPDAPPKAMAEKIRRRLRFPAVKADFIERYFLKMAVEAHHVFGKRLVVSASGAIFAYHLPQARIVLLLSQNNDVYGVNLVVGIYLYLLRLLLISAYEIRRERYAEVAVTSLPVIFAKLEKLRFSRQACLEFFKISPLG
jgi:hypothetical protein